MLKKTLKIYDSTLRDGAQTQGIAFGINDKIRIAEILDDFGVDYIEAGWPGANPTDDEFFKKLPKTSNARLVAFGMTRRPTKTAKTDKGFQEILKSGVSTACIVGKTWDFHVRNALNTTLKKNISMIQDSINYASSHLDEVIFDAEHFLMVINITQNMLLKLFKLHTNLERVTLFFVIQMEEHYPLS